MNKLRDLLNPALLGTQKFGRLSTGETFRQAVRDINNAPIPRIVTHYNKKHQLTGVDVFVYGKRKVSKKEYWLNFEDGKLTLLYVGYYFEELTINEFVDKYARKA